ncbi:GNAT family N-acetyltransferase [Nocardioides sp. Kera G14]|uniref:GNAT family N-acetyltransferase n=1 Tax=Nocardioides sp. Kera G14 TaxID=2884264 RepID=UPI001D110E33|nr:GNAT family N-acetyltransferase [Nocardioides sp. Kera G14]UDY24523.1 GNAT family N-acetyltransferase [Nocardioides sp. Kera G14]
MTRLILPDLTRFEEWRDLLTEMRSETDIPHGSGMWEVDAGITEEGLAQHIIVSAHLMDTSRPAPQGRVHATQFWVTDDEDRLVGFLHMRHELNENLIDRGGHVGYGIRPSRRREGHASAALGLALEHLKALGVDRVLVTCDDDNVASAHTIESQGGVMEDVRNGTRRYWIELA